MLSDGGVISDDKIQFCLYSDENGSKGTLLYFVKSDDTGHNYYISKQGGSESLAVGGDGMLNVNGLMPGTYWLEETGTMDGYTKLDKPIKIVIHGETADSEAVPPSMMWQLLWKMEKSFSRLKTQKWKQDFCCLKREMRVPCWLPQLEALSFV